MVLKDNNYNSLLMDNTSKHYSLNLPTMPNPGHNCYDQLLDMSTGSWNFNFLIYDPTGIH